MPSHSRIHFIIGLLTLCIFTARAQSPVKVYITDDRGNPIAGATVNLYAKKDTAVVLLDFFITRTDGSYIVKTSPAFSSFILNIRALGFKNIAFDFSSRDKYIPEKIALSPAANYLDTVRINSTFRSKVSPDTISFHADAYRLNNERS